MSFGLFAEKVGMSQLFSQDGRRIPITLLKIKNCKVIGSKNIDKHGYNSIVVGFDEVTEKKINKPQIDYFKKNQVPLFRYIKEFRTDVVLEKGIDLLSNEYFANIKFVDVTAISKGKGFAGVMKRHNFAGLRASHGVSISHRSHGSTGNMRKQGKVFKGKKMAGQMGNKQVTVQNLKVIKLDLDNKLFIVEGAVPGYKGALIKIMPAVKKINKNVVE